ncbi:MAG: hypothetical protein PHD76_08865 [Methylacidiphilales bacterium]|nr:hypothetical protein [Candidatus Methylacidiphilales bacterium]
MPDTQTSVHTKRLPPAWQTQLSDFIVSLEWSPDGAWLAAATADGQVSLIPRQPNAPVKAFSAHTAGMGALSWHPNGGPLATAGQDGMVRAWNPSEAGPIWSYQSGRAWIERLAWSPVSAGPENNNEPVLAFAQGKELHLLDARGEAVAKGEPLGSSIADLCWHPGDPIIVTAAYGGLCTWNGQTAEMLKAFEWKGAIWNCRWSPDGRWVCGGSQENAVHIWDAASGMHFHMPGYQSKIRSIDWSADGQWMATSNGIDVLLWDCSGAGPSGRQPAMFGLHSEPVTVIRFQHHGHLFAAGGKDGKLALWNGDGNEEPLAVYMGKEEISAVRWSPDDKLLAAGTASGDVFIF